MTIRLKIKRLHKDITMPVFAHPDDGCFDLYAAGEITIRPGERISIPTGFKMEIPAGYVGFVWDKSSLSHKNGLKTLGGVIDAGFRGEVKIGMINLSDKPYIFKKNDKVAQMAIQKREDIVIEEVEELAESLRGERGFGSTGK
ncbi:MAG: dUTP pyrophosphatase [Parcubacteria group bacterium Gr01-1014_107]|nr:MAG: dUTP pyrophosphatase [Parcubacteria group bacterium Gr01-1014_107]